MKFKHQVLIGASLAVAGITATGIYFLRGAAVETDQTREIAQAESDCANKVKAAIDMVTKRDSMQGAQIQVTGSTNHYNRRLKQCLVDVSTFEHQDTPSYVKTLINVTENSAMLWSIAGSGGGGADRTCFSADSKPLDCAAADQQWKLLLSE